MMITALITGITGQDGSYLADLLLGMGYEVYGLVRRSSVDTTERLAHIKHCPNLKLVEGDITDAACMHRLISVIKPAEVYNLAAMSHVGTSFTQPVATFDIDAIGPLNILEAIHQESPSTRFYQASTSELFGDVLTPTQNETTPFRPRSPYGVAKAAAHYSVKLYREAYGIYACAGILFNHESPRRGENFVTRKITKFVADLCYAIQTHQENLPVLKLGNLEARRDWGHATDYVRAMYLMMQQDAPDDFVIATGETRSIREFLTEAFGYVGLDWEPYVETDPQWMRPADVQLLCGDAAKARTTLGWNPHFSFQQLVAEMTDTDCTWQGVDIAAMRRRARQEKAAACLVS